MKRFILLKLLIVLSCLSSFQVQAGIARFNQSQFLAYNSNQVFFECRIRVQNVLKVQVTRNVVTVYFKNFSDPNVDLFMKPYFGKADRYDFFHRDDYQHSGLHLHESEIDIDHAHISHLRLFKIDVASFSQLMHNLVANSLLTIDSAQFTIERFKRSRYHIQPDQGSNASQSSYSDQRLRAYTMVGSCVWDYFRLLFRS